MSMVRMMVSQATKYIALMMEEKHREIIKARWTHLMLIVIMTMQCQDYIHPSPEVG